MSFDLRDHATNRLVTITLNDFLDRTVGDAIRLAADLGGVPERDRNALARHVVNLAQSGLDGMRGQRFSGAGAVVSFAMSELNSAIDDHYTNAYPHYDRHIAHLKPYEKGEIMDRMKSRASREAMSLLKAYLEHRLRHG